MGADARRAMHAAEKDGRRGGVRRIIRGGTRAEACAIGESGGAAKGQVRGRLGGARSGACGTRAWARGWRTLLLAALVCTTLRIGACVPMGARDVEDGGTAVPPVHYGAKNLDLSKPRVVAGGEADDSNEYEDLSTHRRSPPDQRGKVRSIPKSARMEELQEDGGRNPGDENEQELVKTSVWTVAFNTLLMAVASGFGAAPFFIVNTVNRKWLGIANALASGVMLAASFGLIQEGLEGVHKAPHTLIRLMGGMVLGLVFIIVSQQLVDGHEMSMGSLRGLDARKALMVMGIMTLHSFSEGLGVGVSYGGEHGRRQGMVTTWAIALHNVPEGLAVALVAVPRGESKWTAVAWAVISSLPQPIVAIPAYLFVEWFTFLLPIGLGCAAGTMIWMVFAELIPDAMKATDAHTIATVLTLALIFQVALQSLIETSM